MKILFGISQIEVKIMIASIAFSGITRAQEFSWSAAVQKSTTTISSEVVKDTLQNIYISGSFSKIWINDSVLISGFFVSQYDTSGALNWTKDFFSQADPSIDINSENELVLAARDEEGYYFAKYSTQGIEISKSTVLPRSGMVYKAQIKSVAADRFGNSFIAGVFRDTLDIHDEQFVNAEDNNHFFLIKLTKSGTLSWVKVSTGGHIFSRVIISTDINGNCYLSGQYISSLIVETDTLLNEGFSDGFLCKYDSVGSYKWSYSLSGADQDFITAAGVDTAENVYFIGYSDKRVIVSGDTLGSVGRYSGFICIVKLNSSGAPVWGREISGAEAAIPGGISVERDGSCYLTGCYRESTNSGTLNLSSAASGYRATEPIIAKYDNNGDLSWMIQGGCSENSSGYSTDVLLDPAGNVYAIGTFYGNIGFNGKSIESDRQALFLIKISE
jgi:hypothetical protein